MHPPTQTTRQYVGDPQNLPISPAQLVELDAALTLFSRQQNPGLIPFAKEGQEDKLYWSFRLRDGDGRQASNKDGNANISLGDDLVYVRYGSWAHGGDGTCHLIYTVSIYDEIEPAAILMRKIKSNNLGGVVTKPEPVSLDLLTSREEFKKYDLGIPGVKLSALYKLLVDNCFVGLDGLYSKTHEGKPFTRFCGLYGQEFRKGALLNSTWGYATFGPAITDKTPHVYLVEGVRTALLWAALCEDRTFVSVGTKTKYETTITSLATLYPNLKMTILYDEGKDFAGNSALRLATKYPDKLFIASGVPSPREGCTDLRDVFNIPKISLLNETAAAIQYITNLEKSSTFMLSVMRNPMIMTNLIHRISWAYYNLGSPVTEDLFCSAMLALNFRTRGAHIMTPNVDPQPIIGTVSDWASLFTSAYFMLSVKNYTSDWTRNNPKNGENWLKRSKAQKEDVVDDAEQAGDGPTDKKPLYAMLRKLTGAKSFTFQPLFEKTLEDPTSVVGLRHGPTFKDGYLSPEGNFIPDLEDLGIDPYTQYMYSIPTKWNKPLDEQAKNACEVWLVERICGGDYPTAQILSALLTRILCNSQSMSNFMLYLHGQSGIGKSELMRAVSILMGPNNATRAPEGFLSASPQDFRFALTDKMACASLWCLDEAEPNEHAAPRVRALLGFGSNHNAPNVTVEKKGVDPYTVAAQIRIIATSNHPFIDTDADRQLRRVFQVNPPGAPSTKVVGIPMLSELAKTNPVELLQTILLIGSGVTDEELYAWNASQRIPDDLYALYSSLMFRTRNTITNEVKPGRQSIQEVSAERNIVREKLVPCKNPLPSEWTYVGGKGGNASRSLYEMYLLVHGHNTRITPKAFSVMVENMFSNPGIQQLFLGTPKSNAYELYRITDFIVPAGMLSSRGATSRNGNPLRVVRARWVTDDDPTEDDFDNSPNGSEPAPTTPPVPFGQTMSPGAGFVAETKPAPVEKITPVEEIKPVAEIKPAPVEKITPVEEIKPVAITEPVVEVTPVIDLGDEFVGQFWSPVSEITPTPTTTDPVELPMNPTPTQPKKRGRPPKNFSDSSPKKPKGGRKSKAVVEQSVEQSVEIEPTPVVEQLVEIEPTPVVGQSVEQSVEIEPTPVVEQSVEVEPGVGQTTPKLTLVEMNELANDIIREARAAEDPNIPKPFISIIGDHKDFASALKAEQAWMRREDNRIRPSSVDASGNRLIAQEYPPMSSDDAPPVDGDKKNF